MICFRFWFCYRFWTFTFEFSSRLGIFVILLFINWFWLIDAKFVAVSPIKTLVTNQNYLKLLQTSCCHILSYDACANPSLHNFWSQATYTSWMIVVSEKYLSDFLFFIHSLFLYSGYFTPVLIYIILRCFKPLFIHCKTILISKSR